MLSFQISEHDGPHQCKSIDHICDQCSQAAASVCEDGPMAITGVRARARAEITAEIITTARRQLAIDGAAGLSVRAVARQLGMASSAVYRYVASRDELLTILIVEAYDALGEVAERAAAASIDGAPADRFVAVAESVRAWAVDHPHEYALVYGSPVPGYAAPADTIGAARRVTAALIGVVVDAHSSGDLDAPPAARQSAVPVGASLSADFDAVRAEVAPELGDDVLVRLVAAWTQLFGMVSFELFGQTRNVITAHDELFRATVTTMALHIGLRR